MDKHVFKAGDRVRIILNNQDKDGNPFAGGRIDKDVVGETVTLRQFVRDGAYGAYWRVVETIKGHNYVFDERAFVLADPVAPVVKKEAAPVNMTVDALRKKASALHIVGYSKLKKPALIAAIEKAEGDVIAKPPVPVKPPEPTLYEQLLKKYKNDGEYGICCYAMRFAKDNYVSLNPNSACHASLGIGYENKHGHVVEACDNIATHQNRHIPKDLWEDYKKYVTWILNESPAAPQFLTKNVEDALTKGVYYDVTKPKSHVVASAILLREGSEWVGRLRVITKAVEMGFTYKEAFALSRFLSIDGVDITWKPQRAAHCVMSVFNCTPEAFKLFMNTGFRETKEGPFSSTEGYRIELAAYLPTGRWGSIGEHVSKLIDQGIPRGWGDDPKKLTQRKIFQLGEYLSNLLK